MVAKASIPPPFLPAGASVQFASTSASGASSSVSSFASGSFRSALPRFTFPQKMPHDRTPVACYPPAEAAFGSTPSSLCAYEPPVHNLLFPLRQGPPTRKTAGPYSSPQNLVVPLPALGKKGCVCFITAGPITSLETVAKKAKGESAGWTVKLICGNAFFHRTTNAAGKTSRTTGRSSRENEQDNWKCSRENEQDNWPQQPGKRAGQLARTTGQLSCSFSRLHL